MQEDYTKETQNYMQLWDIFTRNSLEPTFRRSTYSAAALFAIPTGVNIYYIFRVSVLRNIIRVASMITTMTLLHYNLNRDFEAFIGLDTPDSNQARKCIQNISTVNVMFPYFADETLAIINKRQ